MAKGEKLAMLRVRARSLRERALAVEAAFVTQVMTRRAAAVRLTIEEELERLATAPADALPSVKRFLPGPAAALKDLELVLRRFGPNATANSAALVPRRRQDAAPRGRSDDQAVPASEPTSPRKQG